VGVKEMPDDPLARCGRRTRRTPAEYKDQLPDAQSAAQLTEFATEGFTVKLTTDKVDSDSDESEDSDQCMVQ
jgi:hypothetical protein